MDVQKYLQRISYHGSLAPTLETLRALHRAHLLAVPFENLDIPLGRPIVLDEASLFDKIVARRRGGFCYELNGTFAGLLRALGYKVDMLAAQVARADGSFGIPFDHMTLRVQLDEPRPCVAHAQACAAPLPVSPVADGQQSEGLPHGACSAGCDTGWLADVGFGDCFQEPLRLNERDEQAQGQDSFRLDQVGEQLTLMRYEAGEWKPQYQFTRRSYRLADFADGCHYHQTSPQSTFTQRRVCTRATPKGRITLSDMKLVITTDNAKHERMLTSQAAYDAALREHFSIELRHSTTQ